MRRVGAAAQRGLLAPEYLFELDGPVGVDDRPVPVVRVQVAEVDGPIGPGVEVDVHLSHVLVIAMAAEDHLATVVLVVDRQDADGGVQRCSRTGPPPPAVLLL